nr:peroxidase-related enzyme [uncultured Limnohabitans sp.]
MSNRYPHPELKDLPEDIRAKVLEVQDKAGFVPNVFLAFARRPAEWRAFFAYHDALMVHESVGRASGLSKGDREMIVTTTSAANNCLYCVVAHGAILRIYEKKPLVADQVAINYRKADISPRQRAMLDFAMKVCQHSDQIEEADFAALHAHGFNDEDAWDIAAITAFFGLSNRMASFSGMMPNPEFYTMGRVPKQK